MVIVFLWLAGYIHVTHPCIVTVWTTHREMTCTTDVELGDNVMDLLKERAQ